jgi:hypothetical protein
MFGSESGSQGKHMKKLREEHSRYLSTYRKLNGGSLKGATPFSSYYVYRTFLDKYSDLRSSNAMGYR